MNELYALECATLWESKWKASLCEKRFDEASYLWRRVIEWRRRAGVCKMLDEITAKMKAA